MSALKAERLFEPLPLFLSLYDNIQRTVKIFAKDVLLRKDAHVIARDR